MDDKKKVGRPKLPDEDKQRYQRVALYPETYIKAKNYANLKNMSLIDWFDYIVDNIEKK